MDSTSTSGTAIDYDLVYLTQSNPLIIWGSTNYTSLAAFRAATGQEANGLQTNPLWVAPGAGNFHLLPGSAAIDSAKLRGERPDRHRCRRQQPHGRPGNAKHRDWPPRL